MDAFYLADFMELNVSLMLRILHLVISCALPRRLTGQAYGAITTVLKAIIKAQLVFAGGTIIANFPQAAAVFLICQVVDI
ncbi:hypothetical protein EDC91_12525 [Shewanella fodinae]|uniref:Uncharacterized protein n=1 Tax=Shewanella fodinae TaxID=552357 RepID=A0A4R2F617_9GAMM|nr:hypothetical protein EDC91_12525 [Shewanella fodinae]